MMAKRDLEKFPVLLNLLLTMLWISGDHLRCRTKKTRPQRAAVADATIADIIVKVKTMKEFYDKKLLAKTDGSGILDREFEAFKLKPGQIPVTSPDRNDLTNKIRRDQLSSIGSS